MKKRVLIVILDGLGDRPNSVLKGKTPLDSAKTPNIDSLIHSGKSICGTMNPIAKGIAPESDESMISLLGYDVYKDHPGRGPLEAIGAKIKYKAGKEVVFRCNFATFKNNLITDVRSGKTLSDKEVKEFAEIINKKIYLPIKFRFVPTVGYRAVLILEKGSDMVSNTHPGYNIIENHVSSAKPVKDRLLRLKPCVRRNSTAEATETAKIVNEFIRETYRVLKNHPINKERKKARKPEVNVVLTRGAGSKLPKLKPISGKWILMADMPVERAIGKLTGMSVVAKPKDLKKTAKIIAEKLKRNDAVYIEIKGPDSYGHGGDPKGKKKSIEEIDKDFFGTLFKKVNLENTVICVTADHSTPCELGAHSVDPVPLLIYSPEIKNGDKIKTYSEKECVKGVLREIMGNELMLRIEDAYHGREVYKV